MDQTQTWTVQVDTMIFQIVRQSKVIFQMCVLLIFLIISEKVIFWHDMSYSASWGSRQVGASPCQLQCPARLQCSNPELRHNTTHSRGRILKRLQSGGTGYPAQSQTLLWPLHYSARKKLLSTKSRIMKISLKESTSVLSWRQARPGQLTLSEPQRMRPSDLNQAPEKWFAVFIPASVWQKAGGVCFP